MSRAPVLPASLPILGLLVAAAGAATLAPRAAADDTTPSQAYYGTFGEYYQGEFSDALKGFRSEGRGAIKAGAQSWIDSICYHTMSGECYYQMGRYGEALEHYDSALNLYITFPEWMVPGEFQPLRPKTVNRQPPWGRSTRNARLGRVPDKTLIAMGAANLRPVGPNVGLAQPPQLFGLNAQEIVRCTCLALRRKRELMGPASAYDPLLAKVVTALAARPCPPNNWTEAWIDIELAMAYVAVGKDAQAVPLLERGLVAQGEFDHDLTCVGLLELGRIALSNADFAKASGYFEEASYSAFYYENAGVLEEAFRLGALAHLLANRQGVYPPLAAGIDWAQAEDLDWLQASWMLLLAENLAVQGDSDAAAQVLERARPVMARSDMPAARVGCRFNYLLALTAYQQGQLEAGDAALDGALGFMTQGGSIWMFQIGVADAMFTQEIASDRAALALYDALLRDPTPADWVSDPLESIAVLATPHPLSYENWLEAASQRKEPERLLEIADAIRRHRFLSTLALGGRLLALRWQLEGPQRVLDQQAVQQRQDLLVRYAAYAQVSDQAAEVRDALARLPAVPDDPEQASQQADLFAQWTQLSLAQEGMLSEIAIRREPCTITFPPRRTTKEIQEALPEGTAILAFLQTSRQLYGFLLSKDQYAPWQVGSTAAIAKPLQTLLRDLGNADGNAQVQVARLNEDKWRRTARDLLNLLFKNTKNKLPAGLEELVIVPDGVVWHIPFEALLVQNDAGETEPLLRRTRIRYVPTVSLALPDARGRPQAATTGVMLGQLYPGADPALAQAACDDLAQALDGVVALPARLPAASSIYAGRLDRLVVLDDLQVDDKTGPLGWSPLPLDRGQPGSALSDWLGLPWRGPDQVVLPGYHTAAEAALKKAKNGLPTDGSDVFLSVCGLMAGGARTVLLSRWRTGGQTSFDLTREFVQELPHVPASAAWQRSVMLLEGQQVDLEEEPRVSAKSNDSPPAADHPFFWAGYLLVDTGTPAGEDEDAAEEAEEAEAPAAAPRDEGDPMDDEAASDDEDARESDEEAAPDEAEAASDDEPAAESDDEDDAPPPASGRRRRRP
jgi:CHAT domain-containing protein